MDTLNKIGLISIIIVVLFAPALSRADVALSLGLGGCRTDVKSVCDANDGIIVHASVAYTKKVSDSLRLETRYDHFSQYDKGEEVKLTGGKYVGSGYVDAYTINLVYTFK